MWIHKLCTHPLGQRCAAPGLPAAAMAMPDLVHTAAVDRVLLVAYPRWPQRLMPAQSPPALSAGNCSVSGWSLDWPLCYS